MTKEHTIPSIAFYSKKTKNNVLFYLNPAENTIYWLPTGVWTVIAQANFAKVNVAAAYFIPSSCQRNSLGTGSKFDC